MKTTPLFSLSNRVGLTLGWACIFSCIHATINFTNSLADSSIMHWDRRDRLNWTNRIVSALHATLVSASCITTLVGEARHWSDEERIFGKFDGRMMMAGTAFTGYSLYDLTFMLLHFKQLRDIEMIGHHVMFLAVSFYCQLSGDCFKYVFLWLIVGETSTPFLNATKMMKTWTRYNNSSRLSESALYWGAQLLFMVFFFVSRVCLYSFGLFELWNSRSVWTAPTAPFGLRFIVFLLMIGLMLNTFWMRKIARIALSVRRCHE